MAAVGSGAVNGYSDSGPSALSSAISAYAHNRTLRLAMRTLGNSHSLRGEASFPMRYLPLATAVRRNRKPAFGKVMPLTAIGAIRGAANPL